MTNKWRDEAERIEQEIEHRVEADEPRLIRYGSGILLFLAGGAFAAIALVAIDKPKRLPFSPAASPEVIPAAFTPPPLSAIPDGPDGASIRRGIAIFTNPGANASQFVGNSLACSNCHIDAGRRAHAAPMWAAWAAYPQYRKKTRSISTMEDRIWGCFRYSMNAPNSPSGGPPPAGSDIYRDLESYFHWLAKGVPTGEPIKGSGFAKPVLSAAGYDPARGATVYALKCAACHGPDGQGVRGTDGKIIYPPLWGARSYNWGAGMARVDTAAGFIKANMPFGQGNSLTDQQAWDVAAFVDSHERPRDPRQTASVAANAKENFEGEVTYYGKTFDGRLLGEGVAGAR
jgi:thiosulfate dehydrogenase